MRLSIIIVSWNVKERLKKNLQSLYNSEVSFDFEVFVVDNNSHDGSAQMVINEFPQVKLIKNSNNLGFSKANNQAIKLARGDFILLLNPDMEVHKDTLEKMIKWAENNNQAVVSSCKLINSEEKIIRHVRRFPKLFDQLMIILKVPHVFPQVLNKYLDVNFDYSIPSKVDSVRGSFFLINIRSYQKLSKEKPLFDESYFIWFEEVDFCRRVYKLGGEVWYTPVTSCFDYIGQSFSQVRRKETQRYFKNSMLIYFSKWEPGWKKQVLSLAWKFVNFII